MLVLADSNHKRRTVAGGKNKRFTFVYGDKSKASFKLVCCFKKCFFKRRAPSHKEFYKKRYDFGVSFRNKKVISPQRPKLIFQLFVIFNNAVVHDGNRLVTTPVRMRISFGNAPMRCPARMAN